DDLGTAGFRLFGERASDPIEVSPFPQVGEADQENAEKDQNIPECEPGQLPCGFRRYRGQLSLRRNGVRRRIGRQQLPRLRDALRSGKTFLTEQRGLAEDYCPGKE